MVTIAAAPTKSKSPARVKSGRGGGSEGGAVLGGAAAADGPSVEDTAALTGDAAMAAGGGMGTWGEEEDAVLREAVLRYGTGDWLNVSRHMLPSCHRPAVQCELRWAIVKDKVVKGPWLPEEDQLLRDLVGQYGAKKWSQIAGHIPGRAGKQCRERWLNHLDSSVKKSDWNEDEDRKLLEAQRRVGNKWSEIARLLPGRAENAVKNRYNSLITKKLAKRTANIAARVRRRHLLT